MSEKTKRITVTAMLGALAYVSMFVIRVPVGILTYDPKDVIIAIAGLLYGPLTALGISVAVPLLEMITVSSTGFVGCIMNMLSSAAFSVTAALIYKRYRSIKGAYTGLVCAVFAATATMILWNYLIVPIYMKLPREAVVEMLIPLFLPFNLLKGGINAAATALIYKPVSGVLRKANLLPKIEQQDREKPSTQANVLIVIGVLVIFAACIALLLVMQGAKG